MYFSDMILFIRNAGFAFILFCLSYRDIRNNTIPNTGLAAAVMLWAVTGGFTGISGISQVLGYYVYPVICGAVIAGSVMAATRIVEGILKTGSLGMGDIKLIFVICLYTGFWKCMYMLFAALGLGLVVAVLCFGKDDIRPARTFPFGPCLAVSACVFLNGVQGI